MSIFFGELYVEVEGMSAATAGVQYIHDCIRFDVSLAFIRPGQSQLQRAAPNF